MGIIGEKLSGLRLRLVIVYISILFLVFSGIYIWNLYESYMRYREKEERELLYDARTIVAQIDNYIEQMDYILLDTVSDETVINDLKELRDTEVDHNRLYSLTNEISDRIVTESSIRMLNRLSIFTAEGFFVTSNVDRKQNVDAVIKNLWWLNEARKAKGGMVLLKPKEDVWSKHEKKEVISVVRMIRDPGKEIGFIEAQIDYAKIIQLCSEGHENEVFLTDSTGNIFFETGSDDTDRKEILSAEVVSAITGLTCRIQEKISFGSSNFGTLRNTGLLFLAALACCSAVLVIILIYKILNPLISLKEALERTDLDTLKENQTLTVPAPKIQEIESLITSFRKMNLRLQDSIQKERYAYQGQIDAKFEMLQAQINPHFMHNMLNVIANMVYENHSAEIPEICNRLSENIRYSTAAGEQNVTLCDELDFVENYLILIKKRFEHKLEYDIVKENRDTTQIILPKLILIPFVENAVYHPYYESEQQIIRIQILAVGDKSAWTVKITDNGDGFGKDKMKELKKKMDNYLEDLQKQYQMPELSIGGMGIINTYARMKLYRKGEMSLKLYNSPSGGAVVEITGGSKNVSDFGS